MPFQVKGFSDSSSQYKTNGGRQEEDLCSVVNNVGFFFSEPTSVLDSVRSPTTTLSSSHGGPVGAGAGGGGGAVFSGGDGKCDDLGFEDLDGVFDSSPGQEESIFKLIMSGGDVMDPDSTSGFLGFNPGSGFDPVIDTPNPLFGCSFPFLQDEDEEEEKFNPETLLNPNPSFFSTGSDPPPSKRLNSDQPGSQWLPTNQNPGHFSVGSDPTLPPPSKRLNSGQPGSQWVPTNPNPGQFSLKSSPPSKRLNSGQPGSDPGQDPSTVITDQIFNAAAELTGGDNNSLVLAQSILARLNHTLHYSNNNPKPPFQRAALYITQALQSLLQDSSSSPPSPQTLVLRIAAFKTFSETSPFLHFVNFTANQTILESLGGFEKIHIVDFDIGFGSQWSSLIQELGSRRKRLKITAFVSRETVFDEFEVRFTEENLRHFAGEVGVSLEIEFLNLETLLNPSSWSVSEKEAIAVNLPISSVVSGYIPLILQFLKRISPNVVVCSDRSCDRNNDAPFPNVVISALQYYTSLLESLESGIGRNQEVGLSIERFCVQPSIEKLLRNRHRWMERSLPWRSLFGQCGFSPVMFSQMTETQAEYLLQRSPMRGFHLEKRQSSSLVLCWQRKELVAVSAWKCSRGS